MNKYFIITIDTEGDNLWNWHEGDYICTENAKFVPRFQKLCEKYEFIPVYLTNYEMISNQAFADYIAEKQNQGLCEVGMHLHAWSTPPQFVLERCMDNPGQPYLIEYDDDVMKEKIDTMTIAIEKATGKKPVSHRSGRWAMDDRYFKYLAERGYTVDCSVTPHISWMKAIGATLGSRGTDYSCCSEKPYYVEGLLEVPVSTRKYSGWIKPENLRIQEILRSFKHVFTEDVLWLRPTGRNLNKMLYLLERIEQSDDEYIMFMLHSSELMPGGSPTFIDENSIEVMYSDIEIVFQAAKKKGFKGISLRDYAAIYKR